MLPHTNVRRGGHRGQGGIGGIWNYHELRNCSSFQRYKIQLNTLSPPQNMLFLVFFIYLHRFSLVQSWFHFFPNSLHVFIFGDVSWLHTAQGGALPFYELPSNLAKKLQEAKKKRYDKEQPLWIFWILGFFLSFGKGSKKWIYDLCRNLWIFISIRNKIFLGDGFNRVSIIVVVVFAFNCIYSIPTFVIVFVCKLSFYL